MAKKVKILEENKQETQPTTCTFEAYKPEDENTVIFAIIVQDYQAKLGPCKKLAQELLNEYYPGLIAGFAGYYD